MKQTKNFSELIEHYHLYRLGYIFLALILIITSFIYSSINFTLFALIFTWLPVLKSAFEEIKEKQIGSALFLSLATIVAIIGGEEKAAMLILLIILFADYFAGILEERTEHAIASLVGMIPDTVLVKQGESEVEYPLSKVTPGMIVVIKTGVRIPIDGTVILGQALVNQAPITGESKLIEKVKGIPVFAGSFVESGSVLVEVTKVGEETTFGKIKTLVEQAGKRKAKIQILAEKIAVILVPVMAIFIGLTYLFTRDLRLVITLLVFGSPIELAVITPMAILSCIAAAFKQGILVKSGSALERFGSVDTICFDKTGTLTVGEPRIVDITRLDKQHNKQDVIKMAAMAEKRSGHPLSKAVMQKAEEEKITVPDPKEYKSVEGHGVEVEYGGETISLGSKHFVMEHGLKVKNVPVCPDDASHSSFYLVCGEKLCGMICVADAIRPDSKHIIERLRSQGIKKFILITGDNEAIAKSIAGNLGLTEYYANVFPDKKLEIIKKLQAEGHKVAMIGDGINDAPALKQADVGIAMGAMGMEPAIEASDIALMSNDLEKISILRDLSQKTYTIIKQNILFGMGGTHISGIVLAFLKLISPLQAAIFHFGPDFLILLNSVKLLRYKPKEIH